MKKLSWLGIILSLIVGAYLIGFHLGEKQSGVSAVDQRRDIEAIETLLTQQSEAWNRGDIDGFMEGYAQSDALRFASGASITYGWDATLGRYKSSYSDAEKMGELSFDDLEISRLSSTDALVFGHWRLKRKEDDPNGLFTLHLKKQGGEWRIISDHTSSAR